MTACLTPFGEPDNDDSAITSACAEWLVELRKLQLERAMLDQATWFSTQDPDVEPLIEGDQDKLRALAERRAPPPRGRPSPWRHCSESRMRCSTIAEPTRSATMTTSRVTLARSSEALSAESLPHSRIALS
jgi:hypothetical protein